MQLGQTVGRGVHLLLEIIYVDDVLNGPAKGGYPTGEPHWEAMVKDGKVVGATAWDREGNVVVGFDVQGALP